MLKKEKEKFYAIMAAVLLIGLVLVWQGIFTGRMAIGNKIRQIQDKKASIGAYSQREKTLSSVLNNYNSAREKIDEVNERFVSGLNSVDVDKFFSELENAASEASVSMEKAFIENPEAVKNPVKKPAGKESEAQAEEDKFLRLAIKGRYENLLNFIYKLETMPYYIDIKSVNISAAVVSRQDMAVKNNDSENVLQSIVIIKVFKKQEINDKK